MKRILTLWVIVSGLFFISGNANAQSLKDLFNKSNVNDIISSVTKSVLPTELVGNWSYSGTAVKFESDDMLKNAAASLAATQIEKKLNSYTEKIGMKPGTFKYSFQADSTFTTTFKGKSFGGKYSLSPDGKRLTLSYGKTLNLMKMTAVVSITGNQTDIMFKADKLLEFFGKISATSNNAALKSISSLAGQYDGLDIGIGLLKE